MATKKPPTEPTARTLQWMKLSELRPARRNPKTHDQDGIAASVDRFGVIELQTIDERTGRLVSGHGRLEAFQQMEADGTTPPAGVVVDDDGEWTVQVVRGWASRNAKEADAALVAVNRHVETGGWDFAALGELLDDVSHTRAGLAGVGFDQPDLDAMLADITPPPTPEFEPVTDDEQPRLDHRTTHECPSCGFKWQHSTNRKVLEVTE